MPRAKSCQPCLPGPLKADLLEALADRELRRIVEALPECGRPGKRPPSPYTTFISTCMQGKGLKGKGFGAAAPAMQECAAAWRERKAPR